ncbi:MAG TPA: hypothetical protein VG319_03235, partial [Polyangia bacterium]|nr:hypothetical protein [Polyangia bacterium]
MPGSRGAFAAVRIVALAARPLSVPLREPFVIATGRMDATCAALVTVVLEDDTGRRAQGLGEAAALPPVTHEDQPDLLRGVAAAREVLAGETLSNLRAAEALLAAALPEGPVARAGIASALADAWARLAELPLHAFLGGAYGAPAALTTDITLPIGAPEYVAGLARGYHDAGFACFK